MSEGQMTDGIVWINGHLTNFTKAKVSLEDRGFEFGDGIYEVTRVYQGAPFALPEHMARLRRSASGIELKVPMSTEELTLVVHDLLCRSGLSAAELYIQVTRGEARRNHQFPEALAPTVVMGVRPPLTLPSWKTGCNAITHPDERWAHCDLKTICLLPNVLAKQHAYRAGAFEALMVRDNILSEGSTSNVFVRLGRQLVTPIADNRILAGITRAITIELAHECG